MLAKAGKYPSDFLKAFLQRHGGTISMKTRQINSSLDGSHSKPTRRADKKGPKRIKKEPNPATKCNVVLIEVRRPEPMLPSHLILSMVRWKIRINSKCLRQS